MVIGLVPAAARQATQVQIDVLGEVVAEHFEGPRDQEGGHGPLGRNTRLGDALQQWAFSSMRGSAGAKTYYKTLRAKIGPQPALRQLANRWVGILHGCLKTGQPYNETLAWNHHTSATA